MPETLRNRSALPAILASFLAATTGCALTQGGDGGNLRPTAACNAAQDGFDRHANSNQRAVVNGTADEALRAANDARERLSYAFGVCGGAGGYGSQAAEYDERFVAALKGAAKGAAERVGR